MPSPVPLDAPVASTVVTHSILYGAIIKWWTKQYVQISNYWSCPGRLAGSVPGSSRRDNRLVCQVYEANTVTLSSTTVVTISRDRIIWFQLIYSVLNELPE